MPQKIKKPELEMDFDKKIFKRGEDDSKFNLKMLEMKLSKNKILKYQKMSDLVKTKCPLGLLTYDICIIDYFLGNNCYLCFHNNEIKIKRMEDIISVRKFETKFGSIISDYRGEWGGALYNITESGAEKAGRGNFIDVFEYKDNVYGISSISHLTSHWCSLHEIKKYDDRFEDITIFSAFDFTISGCYLEDNHIYFYSNSDENNGLYKLNLDNYEFEVIENDLCPVFVNSLIKKDNLIYIYGNYNLFAYDLNNNKMEFFTNLEPDEINVLYYDDYHKLMDVWDKIIEK